jgi:DNA-binding winged helix-turn-helix (wHTH) protein/Tol biopolymer transport system component
MKSSYSFGSFALDADRRALHRQGIPVPLTPKAFDLLLYLVKNPNRAITKEELLQGVWADSFVEEGNLTQNVFLLRKALADDSGSSAVIVTIPRKGYQFAAEVAAVRETEGLVGHEEPGKSADKLVVQDFHAVTRIVVEEEVEEETELSEVDQFKAWPARDSRKWSWRFIRPLVLAAVLSGAVAGVWAFLAPQPMPKVLRSVQLTQFGRAEPGSPVVTDGTRLYFTERIGGSWWLAQVSEQGGQPTVVSTSVPGVTLFDIDRSRSRLLFGARGPNNSPFIPLWEVPTSGGSAQRLGDAQCWDAAWSPDGQSLAYGREGGLFVAHDDGQQPRKLFSRGGYVEHPRWSPDGQHLSFSVMDLTTSKISLWEIAASGSDPHPLSLRLDAGPLHRWGDGECCGDWSPDGKYFVFRSLHDGVASLWAVRQNTRWFQKRRGTLAQLYTSPDYLGEPRFSADGKRIFFVDYHERRELVRYDVSRKIFVPYLGGIAARHLQFSRDGQWVAYKNEADGSLWRSRPDGTQALRLTFPPLEVMHSSWSPDGKKIAFQAGGKLYQVPFEGGKTEPLLPEDIDGTQPSWSPDGGALLFVRRTAPEAGGWHPAIHHLDLNTRQVQMIPGSQEYEGPQWSPDGKYAAASDTKGHKLVVFDFARQQWSELADGTPYGWGIRWSADGRYVYYQHLFEGEEQPIFRVGLIDRRVEQITSSRQILRADVLSYSMTGLAPDDSPLVSFVHRNSDVYALELDIP